ncbi:uncharacterized protein LOC130663384 [Microplitis mediator]|uniref:uncharacterized protein LOC130663384 n=1 Tax=Microplitis mediator TaxID=375433 RepID=UPI0025577FE6|nr:uncharacterized protein LOC130663384 [Microplitis mediator]XP_057318550.1 uncharacterized protein LOC130663384 [Microplitis mediator]
MGQFAVVRLKDAYSNKWVGVPELWVTDDKKECWWPDINFEHKAKNEIIFNSSSKEWYLRPLDGVYFTDYETFNDANDKAFHFNWEDTEEERYEETSKILEDLQSSLDSHASNSLDNQKKMIQAIEEIKKTLKADVNTSTLGALLPIKNPKSLRKFEKLYMAEDAISQAFKELIIILTDDENLTESVSKILGAVFSNQLAAQCSWDGWSGIEIKDSSIIKKIDKTLKNIDEDYKEFEEDVTLWFQNKKKKSTIRPD